MKVVRLFRISKFWLLQSQHCILYICCVMLREECDQSKKSVNSWVANLKNKLKLFIFGLTKATFVLIYIFLSLSKGLWIFIYKVILNR